MKTYTFEVSDSDGYDSTQEVQAADERTAKRLAIARHEKAIGYAPDAGPHIWVTLEGVTA